jgi:hypothetical protein
MAHRKHVTYSRHGINAIAPAPNRGRGLALYVVTVADLTVSYIVCRYKLPDAAAEDDIQRLKASGSYSLAGSYTSSCQTITDVAAANSFMSTLLLLACSNRSIQLVDAATMQVRCTAHKAAFDVLFVYVSAQEQQAVFLVGAHMCNLMAAIDKDAKLRTSSHPALTLQLHRVELSYKHRSGGLS